MTTLVFEEDLTSAAGLYGKLKSPVATGSFSEVYRCTIESSVTGKTEVAVKVFKVDPRKDVNRLEKTMLRELTVWLKLKDPTIVPLLGTARVKSPLRALVCQWMPSGTLFEYFHEQATNITPSAKIKLVEGIAEGLDYLHSEDVIHGDLHPGNVLIDDLGNPRLADFGLAAFAASLESQLNTTTVGQGLKTRWRAPEAVRIDLDGSPGRPTFKSDIYSFGGVTFYVISGDMPWKDTNSNQICIKLSQGITTARPDDIFHDHWNFIQKCWSWEPRDRPKATSVLNWVQVMAEYPRDATSDFMSQVSDKIRSPIATGSFGEVYRCIVESSRGKTEVAVKVFKIDPRRTMKKLMKAMFDGIRMWLRLKHSNIVPLLGTAIVGSPLPALVSQWMSSGILSEYLKNNAKTITPSVRHGLVNGIAKGLHYLHSENVIHGDLHPGNVLMDSLGNPCLTDFGFATVAEDPGLQWTTMTVDRNFDSRWRAPEVIGIDGGPGRPTFKSDVYSFGSVMFFIVSEDIPWKEEDSPQINSELSRRVTPTRPHNIFYHHWKLIQECWSWEPGSRPDATGVLNRVETMPLPSGSTPPKNIVFFGQLGAGKDSVVNLMAGKDVARTSPDMERCTMHLQEYRIEFDGHYYRVFDTVGLEEPQLGMNEYLEVIENAYRLIEELQRKGGIDLLLFCVRASQVTATLQTNYRLFHEWLCEKKVPIVLVLTGLEREQRMEDWWTRNERVFQQYNINVAGHACITAANKLDGRHMQLYEESRLLVRDLVFNHTHGREGVAWKGGEECFTRFSRMLKALLLDGSKPKKKDIVGVLTKRCGIPRDAAVYLANIIQAS